jgi:ADP-dependent NAD(P)H-hydrate dehydratase / NAD(P)H-hydrate epimerase
MVRIDNFTCARLHTARQTKALETLMAAKLPPHELMQRAGEAVARLAKALVPHARCIWIACGPGNNGGDGLTAACALLPWAALTGTQLVVTWEGDEKRMPPDARNALERVRRAGITLSSNPPVECDLVIDAVFGLGVTGSAGTPRIGQLIEQVNTLGRTRLCVDTPSGLDADTGKYLIAETPLPSSDKDIFTLTFLTLKPGLFTADGRDRAGQVWFDDLGSSTFEEQHSAADANRETAESAWLGSTPPMAGSCMVSNKPISRSHNSHKGSQGDVWVVGGQHASHNGSGMTGAAVLSARAALHQGAGRVFVVPLGNPMVTWDGSQPELMFRSTESLDRTENMRTGCWVCGCGGGELVQKYIPTLLLHTDFLVLDADALNAISQAPHLIDGVRARANRGQTTVMTPHPLEAARLRGASTVDIQSDRLAHARDIAKRYQSICVLKGSGTVVATPGGTVVVNPSGNAALATAGTGDVLAGMLGAALARLSTLESQLRLSQTEKEHATLDAVTRTVWLHGCVADKWPKDGPSLTASRLCRSLNPDGTALGS